MYAVVKIGSEQFKVAEGETIQSNRLKNKEGDALTIEKVLLYVNGSDIRIGQPYLEGINVTAKVVKHPLGPKVVNYRYRRRKDSSRKVGHRQKLTELNITKISG